jgi:hypothetical protein
MQWRNPDGTTNIIQCRPASVLLDGLITAEAGTVARAKGLKLFANLAPAAAQAEVMNTIPGVVDAYSANAIATTGPEWIKQTMTINALRRSAVGSAASGGASEVVMDFAIAQSEVNRNTMWATVGRTASKILPLMKNAFEAILYAIFPIVFLLMLLPSGYQMLGAYIRNLIWLQLWAPLYAVLNLMMTFHGQGAGAGSLYDATQTQYLLTVATAGGQEGVHAEMSILAGYLSMLIPLLAFGIVSGGRFAMAQLASQVMNPGSQSATQSASEITRGNLSLSQVNTAPSVSYGHGVSNYVDPKGNIHRTTADGTQILDQKSLGGSKLFAATSINSQVSETAQNNYREALSATLSSQNQVTKGLQGIYSDYNRAQTDLNNSKGNSDTYTRAENHVNSIRNSESDKILESFANKTGASRSEASATLFTIGARANAGVDVSGDLMKLAGGKGKISARGGGQIYGDASSRESDVSERSVAHEVAELKQMAKDYQVAVIKDLQTGNLNRYDESNTENNTGASGQSHAQNELLSNIETYNANINRTEAAENMLNKTTSSGKGVSVDMQTAFTNWAFGNAHDPSSGKITREEYANMSVQEQAEVVRRFADSQLQLETVEAYKNDSEQLKQVFSFHKEGTTFVNQVDEEFNMENTQNKQKVNEARLDNDTASSQVTDTLKRQVQIEQEVDNAFTDTGEARQTTENAKQETWDNIDRVKEESFRLRGNDEITKRPAIPAEPDPVPEIEKPKKN